MCLNFLPGAVGDSDKYNRTTLLKCIDVNSF